MRKPFPPKLAEVLRIDTSRATMEVHNMLEEIEAQQARIAELEAAIDKLAQCKGRFHTEANFKALIAVREKNLRK